MAILTHLSQGAYSAGVRSMGICSATGLDVGEVAESLRIERSGLRPISRHPFIRGEFTCGEVPLDCDLADRPTAILNQALSSALRNAKLSTSELKRTGVFAGTTSGFFVDSELNEFRGDEAPEELRDGLFTRLIARSVGQVAIEVARIAQARGPIHTYSIACTSSTYALLEAWRYLNAGVIDHAIIVGFETLLNMTCFGFKSLMLYDREAHRPFDRRRGGLQLGEGCAVIVLDRESAGYRFKLRGGTARNDTFNMTGTDTSGDTIAAFMRQLLSDTNSNLKDIVAIKAHGTGTLDNDMGEGRGYAKAFDQFPPFASLKAYMGHGLGAAGALEAVSWLACLENGFIPRSLGFNEQDPEIGVSPLTSSQASRCGLYPMTSFGFGGSSVALMFDYQTDGNGGQQ